MEVFSSRPTRGGRSADDRFAQLDADDDGYVSQAEMRQAREGARARRPAFSELDSDGDGQLSAAELEAVPSRGNRRTADRFNHLDADGDGYVSQEELQAGARHRPPGGNRQGPRGKE